MFMLTLQLLMLILLFYLFIFILFYYICFIQKSVIYFLAAQCPHSLWPPVVCFLSDSVKQKDSVNLQFIHKTVISSSVFMFL